MTKSEFLSVLREALINEIDEGKIEQNIRFYSDYISSKGVENEENVTEELGDPRLIAKSIIDANQNRGSFHSGARYTAESAQDYEEETAGKIHYKVFSPLKWYHKVIGVVILIAVAFLLIYIGRIFLGFVFTFGLPLLIIWIVVSMLRNRR